MVACHKIPIQKQVVCQYIRNKQTMVKAEGERKEGEQETTIMETKCVEI